MAGGKYNFLLFLTAKNQAITPKTGRASSAVNYKKIFAFIKRYRVRKTPSVFSEEDAFVFIRTVL